MTSAASLYDVCAELLAAAVTALSDPPGRRYVSPGPVALDCEQLTVHAAPIQMADTSPTSPLDTGRRVPGASVNMVGLVITVVRCVPTVESLQNGNLKLPSAVELDASAQVVLADGWSLWNGIKRKHRAGDLLGTCRNVVIDPAIPITPSGGLGGWQMTVRANLDGYAA